MYVVRNILYMNILGKNIPREMYSYVKFYI